MNVDTKWKMVCPYLQIPSWVCKDEHGFFCAVCNRNTRYDGTHPNFRL